MTFSEKRDFDVSNYDEFDMRFLFLLWQVIESIDSNSSRITKTG